MAQVADVDFAGAGRIGLLLHSVKIFLLADIPDVGDDLIALVDQPFQDDRRIETAAIGENNFFFLHGTFLHQRSVLMATIVYVCK